MNNVYFFMASDDAGGVYVAAPTWQEAHKQAWKDPIIYEQADSYIDARGNIVKGKKTNIPTGILTTQEICDEGLAWWECPGDNSETDPTKWCGSQDFEIFDKAEMYRCKVCGHEDQVPYADI